MSKRVSLVAINPSGLHNTSLYLLKSYALKFEKIKNNIDLKLHFFDSLVMPQSNQISVFAREIIDDMSSIVCFSCYCWNIDIVLNISRQLKQIRPNIKILLGGPEASGTYDTLLSNYDFIDYIIYGEGEIAFSEYLKYLIGLLKNKRQIHNFVYRENGKVQKTSSILLDNLDDIPHLFYNGIVDANEIGDSLYSFETKRGCEYNCSYCLHHKGSHIIREYSLNYVFKELSSLLKSKLKYIWIIDPCFNENEDRSIKILEYIDKNNKKNIEFGFEIRNETMSENFIKTICSMKWIKFIAVGLQTLNKVSLDSICRRLDFEKFEENIFLLQKYGNNITIHVDLIYGLPNDNIDEYKKSIDYVLSKKCEIFTQVLKVLPGSQLFLDRHRYGLVIDKVAPYELIASDTFTYEDICRAKNINAVLNLYQADEKIKTLLNNTSNIRNIALSDLFDLLGKSIWEKGYYNLFKNNFEFRISKIINILIDEINEIFKEPFINENILNDDYWIKPDWGSIAPVSKKEFCEE